MVSRGPWVLSGGRGELRVALAENSEWPFRLPCRAWCLSAWWHVRHALVAELLLMWKPDKGNTAWRFCIRPALVACVVGCLFVVSHGDRFRSAYVWRLVGDKIPHMVAYAVLAAFMVLVGVRGLLGVALLIAVASVDELTQPWFGRSCTLGDWLADLAVILGVYAGYALVRCFVRRRSLQMMQ